MSMAEAIAAGERKLGEYLGIPIIGQKIAVRNAGDGLSKAMKFNALPDAGALNLGRHKVYVVLECDVVDHQHPLVKDHDDVCELKVILKAGDATLIDGEVVQAQLERQRVKILEAEEVARNLRGEGQLPGVTGNGAAEGDTFTESDEAAVLSLHHKQGLHDQGPVEGCPHCADLASLEG